METEHKIEGARQEAPEGVASSARMNHARALWRHRREMVIAALGGGIAKESAECEDCEAMIAEIEGYGLTREEILEFCREVAGMADGPNMDEIRRRPNRLKELLRQYRSVRATRLNDEGENDYQPSGGVGAWGCTSSASGRGAGARSRRSGIEVKSR